MVRNWLGGVTCRCRRRHGTVRARYPADDKGNDKQKGNKNSGFLVRAYLHETGSLLTLSEILYANYLNVSLGIRYNKPQERANIVPSQST